MYNCLLKKAERLCLYHKIQNSNPNIEKKIHILKLVEIVIYVYPETEKTIK